MSTRSSTVWPANPTLTPLSDHASGPAGAVRRTGASICGGRHAAGSCDATLPPSTATSVSAIRLRRSRRCSEITTACPVSASRDTADRTSEAPSGSSCEVGSSSTTRSGCMERSEEHTSELQSPYDLVCRLLLEKKKKTTNTHHIK